MAATCDACGTQDKVRRAFVTLWNGNIMDLCAKCSQPLSALLDDIWFGRGTWPPPAGG